MALQNKLGELWDRLRGKGPAAAVALSLDLGTARDNVQVSLQAGGLLVERCDGDLSVRINGPNGDPINLRYVRRISVPFSLVYLSNSAQSGRWAKLLLLADGMDADVRSEISVVGAYLAPSALGAGGTATIWTPGSGKGIRLKRVSLSVSAATRIDLRWSTTAWESFYLPTNGSVVVNLVCCNEQGGVNEALTVASSAAATLTARAAGEEV